jgi:hypothetical protein
VTELLGAGRSEGGGSHRAQAKKSIRHGFFYKIARDQSSRDVVAFLSRYVDEAERERERERE